MGVSAGAATMRMEASGGMTDSSLIEPRYEAAFFYALFLRGCPLEKLRADIDVPPHVQQRWDRMAVRDPWYRATVNQMLSYRKEVLAIFDSLVLRELPTPTPSVH